MVQKPIEAVLLGAGSRGLDNYGAYAEQFPHRMKLVAVAEPLDDRREEFARRHRIPKEKTFRSWEDLLDRSQAAPALINATMDGTHHDSTLAAVEKGYHILLEKPMSADAGSCLRIVRAARASGKILQVCHNMRYTRFFETLKEILEENRAGDVVTVQHNEHIAYWHMAHSFVRGKWGSQTRSSPMILAKSCHDMDILVWLIDKKPRRVSSFGSLYHFRPDRVGAEIPERCTDGCPRESTCAFAATRFYLGENTDWPVSAISLDRSLEARRRALETGPYGRCVYRCDNDAVDHQVTVIEFEEGVTACFTMQGHSHDGIRTMRYCGTAATIRGHCENGEIDVHEYATGRVDRIRVPGGYAGHGGGDWRLLDGFCDSVRNDSSENILTSAEASLPSHLLCFAAEKSRRENVVVDMDSFRAEMEPSDTQ